MNPFQLFLNWLFDGNFKSSIDESLLKYNSPITPFYVINLFTKVEKLTTYLDLYFNNFGLYYLSKEELFKFIKKCVIDLRLSNRDVCYHKRGKKETKEFSLFKQRYPYLKDHDTSLLMDLVDRHPEKDSIYQSFGLTDSVKKEKQKKKEEPKKLTLKKFLENFEII